MIDTLLISEKSKFNFNFQILNNHWVNVVEMINFAN